MSPNNHNIQPTNHESFAKKFSDFIADARERGQAPPTGEAAIEGMNLIAALYHSCPPSEQAAKIALNLTRTLFYDFPHFRETYEAAAKQYKHYGTKSN